MVVKEEQERVRTLISDTVTLLCRNGLSYKSKFCINALIGITLDEDDVFLVDIRETIKNLDEYSDAIDSDVPENTAHSSKSRKHKKTRKRPRDNADTQAQNETFSTEEASFDGSDHENNDTSNEPATKSIKQEAMLQEEDSEDLVFIKDEPGDKDFSSCSYGNTSGSQSFQTQQQNSDILDSLAQQGQLYATPATGNTQTSWDVSQGQIPYSQAIGLGSQPPLLANNPQDSPSQGDESAKMFRCSHCPARLSTLNNLQRHEARHRGVYSYPCPHCDKGFASTNGLNGHMVTAHNMEQFKSSCPVCYKQYTRRDNMKHHIRAVHGLSSQEAEMLLKQYNVMQTNYMDVVKSSTPMKRTMLPRASKDLGNTLIQDVVASLRDDDPSGENRNTRDESPFQPPEDGLEEGQSSASMLLKAIANLQSPAKESNKDFGRSPKQNITSNMLHSLESTPLIRTLPTLANLLTNSPNNGSLSLSIKQENDEQSIPVQNNNLAGQTGELTSTPIIGIGSINIKSEPVDTGAADKGNTLGNENTLGDDCSSSNFANSGFVNIKPIMRDIMNAVSGDAESVEFDNFSRNTSDHSALDITVVKSESLSDAF